MIDSDFSLKFANPEFSNLLGYSEEELEGVNIHDIIHSHGEEQNPDCPIYSVLKTGEKQRMPEDYFITKSGLILPVSYVVSPLKRND